MGGHGLMPGSGLAAELPHTVEQACAGSKSSLSGCPIQWEGQDPILGATLHADEGHRASPRFPGESLTLVQCGTSESGAGLGKCGLQKQGE